MDARMIDYVLDRVHKSVGAALRSLLISYLVIATLALPTISCTPDSASQPTAPHPTTGPELEAIAVRYDHWIARMDPYVHENQTTGAFELDRAGFISSLRRDDAKIASAIENAEMSNEDAATIRQLEESIARGNSMRAEVQARMEPMRSSSPAATQACSSISYKWWGVVASYWSICADTQEALLCGGAIATAFWWLSAVYLGSLCYWANKLNDSCPSRGFCLNVTWAGVGWVTCR